MATLLRFTTAVANGLRPLVVRRSARLYEIGNMHNQQMRNTSFFVKLTADQLWKGVVSVSNAGRKRGRGKRRSRNMTKNLNRGQVIGVGKENMVWPGLNAPVLRGKEIVERMQLPPDPEREERLIKLRDETTSFRTLKLSPLERGYSGTKWPGRSIGPPDPVIDETFEGFDTKVLEVSKTAVFSMTATFGRKRRVSAFVVTGNRNGSAGFALSKAVETMAALRKSKNRAAQRLMFVERFREHTVYHDFYTRFGQTEIFVHKKPKGYGLVCHRVLRSICEIIGITDIHAKIEGAVNVQNMTKAFFLGLLKQKTHQRMADEKGLYVVEFTEENDRFPRVVAAPSRARTDEELSEHEVVEYDDYVTEGKVELVRPKPQPFYMKLPGWKIHLGRTVPFRNHHKYKVQVTAEYGELTSFILKDQNKRIAADDRNTA